MAKRTWQIDIKDYGTDEEFRAAVINELAAFENIGHRIGLALTAAPMRKKLGEDFVTTGWRFRTDTVPTIQPNVVHLAPAPAPEEPAEAPAEGASF